jgi:putative flippase GtrA
VAFAMIGSVSTATSVALFLLTRQSLGAVAANLVALSATAAANTWANRRYTFSRRDASTRHTDVRRGLAIYLGGAAFSSALLAVVEAADAGPLVELGALATAWSATSVARFRLLRRPAGRPGPKD